MNYEGRIALKPDLFFGAGTLYWTKQVEPMIDKLQDKYGKNIIHNAVFAITLIIFVLDIILTIYTGRPAQ